ncbi:MAG TPA: bifunctional demethylmenaquinone methyltransferase/2-methoxy-6-polyprenyl-1,4-benzoquinol methylase UbiE [Bryobacteraceae bacterium]|nr:bifunctional demethylmenaquinone methyltransferase/2-methoxy-6-polyprenyl-1,4-benzoquinol methylase UbiE [Bryobacteraceae bacterium]
MGTTPQGARTEQEAAAWVRGMFSRIAGRYDLLNHLLSFNLDRYWRRRAVESVCRIKPDRQARMLDLCCGTGDVLIALEQRRGAPSLGVDFAHPMLTAAARKIAERGFASPLIEADGLLLPLRDDAVDAITIAFGFRNFANYRRGLGEMLRVLKPDGIAAILEFSQPRNRAFNAVYGWFSKFVLPRVGGLISGSRQAYAYLPESISKFPGADELAAEMLAAGFSRVEYSRMTFGAVALHIGWKSGPGLLAAGRLS